MRILFFTTNYLPVIGGAQLAMHHLAEGLVSLGHSAMVLAPFGCGPAFRHTYEERRFAIPKGLYRLHLEYWWYRRVLLHTARRWKPDIVHAWPSIPSGYAAVAAAKTLRVPVLMSCQGEDIQCLPEIGYGYRLDPSKRPRIEFAVRGADRLIAISEDIRDDYISAGANPARIDSIPNAVDDETLASRAPAARRRLNVPEDVPVVLSVGRNHPKKDFPFLLKAFVELRRKVPEAICLIVGKDVPVLRDEVAALGLTDAVRLHDSVLPVGLHPVCEAEEQPVDIATFYHAADIYALPSLIEGNPLVVNEAMAAGLPVVARDAPGVRGLVEDGDTACVARGGAHDFGEILASMVADVPQRKQLAETGRRKAAAFGRKTIARQTLAVYEALLK